MSEAKQSNRKCSLAIRNVPPERYRLPDDRRKWKQACRDRKTLLDFIAGYANPDGTRACVGIPSMMGAYAWSHGKVCYLLTDLERLGFLSRAGLSAFHGTANRTVNVAAVLGTHEPRPDDKKEPEGIQDTAPTEESKSPTYKEEVQDRKVGVQLTKKESKLEEKESNLYVGRNRITAFTESTERDRKEKAALALQSENHGQELEDVILCVEKTAKVVDRAAKFSKKSKSELREIITLLQIPRDWLVCHVRRAVTDMADDAWLLKKAGQELADNLEGDYLASGEVKAAAERQRIAEEAAIATALAQAQKEREARLLQQQEDQTVVNPFGEPDPARVETCQHVPQSAAAEGVL